MGRPVEEGEPAKFNYQKVVYSHFDVGPGESLLLTADPWSFLHAFLSRKQLSSRGDNRASYIRAVYYAELAQGFYHAGETAALPTKGTLIYYGMLNLAKCFLAVNRIPLEEKTEHHGLTLPPGKGTSVQVAENAKSVVNVFHEFSRLLRTPVTGKATYDLTEICAHIPEIHEVTFALGHVGGGRRSLLPVQIRFLVNRNRDRIFAEMCYEKKNEARVQISKLLRGNRKDYFNDLGDRDGWQVLRSKRRRPVNKSNWPRTYRSFCKEFEAFELASILTHEGYRYYVDLGPRVFHHLAWSLMLMYYVGTVARYRPLAAKAVMEGELRPLVSEAVAVCPRQFLYQMTSLITKRICSVPHASLV